MNIDKRTKNSEDDYGFRRNPDYRRQDTIDIIYDRIQNTNWNKESDYYNSVRVNGVNTTRTLKFKK